MLSSSCIHVAGGLMAVTVAILTGVIFHFSTIPSDIHIQLDLASAEQSNLLLGKSTSTLTQQQIADYRRDGVVVIRGLISEQEASQLRDSANYASSRLLDIFRLFGNSRYQTIRFDLWRTSPEIATLALQSLPRVAAQLMVSTALTNDDAQNSRNQHTNGVTSSPKMDRKTTNIESIRLLRDAFFAYQPPGEACGWHVDDAGFWPALDDTTGPTFWIALDPLFVRQGGGLAVLNRTLFRETEPLEITEESCRKAIAAATCEMSDKSPECHAKMEASKIQADMTPGDAIVWDRFTFHRGVAGTDLLPQDAVKQRYSVRYMPQGSRAFGSVHTSVEQYTEFNSPYYPQVWPILLESEMKALEHGLDSDMTITSAISFLSKRIVGALRKRLLVLTGEKA